MSETNMKRRQFLRNSALGIVGAGVASSAGGNLFAGEEKKEKKTETKTEALKIKQYRKLGRTGFMASDISSGGPQNLGVINALLDAGVNYIDTAESYSNGQSEVVTGQALKGRDRKKIFITTKLVVKKEDTKETILKRFGKSLERMATPYADCLMMHSVGRAKDITYEHFHAATKQLKAEGKLRFVGISNHGPQWKDDVDSMKDVMLASVADGRFDVVLFVYNYIQAEDGMAIIKACKAKDIGMTLMKVNPVGGYMGFKEKLETLKKEGKPVPKYYNTLMPKFEAAAKKAEGYIKKHKLTDPVEIRDNAIKYALDSDVATVTCSLTNFDQVDGFLKLSGKVITGKEKKKLAMFKEGCGSLYCRHACGICETKCPSGVPVNTILRYNHYFEAQGREKHAMEKYAKITTANASKCESCDGHCVSGCPFGVPVPALMTMAHQRLSLA